MDDRKKSGENDEKGPKKRGFRRKNGGKFAKGNRGGPGRPPRDGREIRTSITIKHRPPPAEPPTWDVNDDRFWDWQNAQYDWILNGAWELK